jgi:hypothetical protein
MTSLPTCDPARPVGRGPQGTGPQPRLAPVTRCDRPHVQVAEIVCVRALLVHALDERDRDFYLHHEFEPSPTGQHHSGPAMMGWAVHGRPLRGSLMMASDRSQVCGSDEWCPTMSRGAALGQPRRPVVRTGRAACRRVGPCTGRSPGRMRPVSVSPVTTSPVGRP